MTSYSRGFHQERHQRTLAAAERILGLLFEGIPSPKSAIDIGCGVGTWLSLLRAQGVENLKGVDGDWVDSDLLEIPESCFTTKDLAAIAPEQFQERYDLAISLEVAEHLPEQSAGRLIASLVQLSDFVLFSAAIPGQGGTNHLNEQWQSYWAELFAAHDYVALDLIRPYIWQSDDIPWWYRQNILVYCARSRTNELPARATQMPDSATLPLDVVHPTLYLKRVRQRIHRKHLTQRIQSSIRSGWRRP